MDKNKGLVDGYEDDIQDEYDKFPPISLHWQKDCHQNLVMQQSLSPLEKNAKYKQASNVDSPNLEDVCAIMDGLKW